MKIVSVRTHILKHTLDQAFDSAFSTFFERWACLVEITCDDGTVGWGECLGPAGPNAALVDAMAPRLLGKNALDIEPIWTDIYNHFRDQGQRGATMTAQSGIDIALWDIAGKHFAAPVHRLLGGAYRMMIPAYATGGFRPVGRDRISTVVDEVKGYMDAGFKATKIKVGFGIDEDARLIEAVRDVVGPDRELMIDANHGFDAVEAIRLGNRVAGLDISWFEEPVIPETLDAYCEVKARQPIPIAGGETWHGRLAFAQAIEKRAVDILQPDVCGCGGITEMKKIFAQAETAGIRVVPHVWGTGVAIAASLQMLAILPPMPLRHASRAPWLEFDQTHNPYRQSILTTPFAQKDGNVAVPEGPGLGIEIIMEEVLKYRVGGTEAE